MAETFPSAPRAPGRVRLFALAIGLAGISLAARTTLTSAAWVGRTFPGFPVLINRVVPSVSLARWSGSSVPDLYQSQVLAVDGTPVTSAQAIYDLVASRPPGTPFRYLLEKGGRKHEVVIPSQRFGLEDWVFIFGAYLLNSTVGLISGLVVWVLRPNSALARAFLAFGAAWAAFFLTAMDLYGPWTFVRVHHFVEPLAAAAALQLFMLFPQPHPWARWRFVGYAAALPISLAYQVFLYTPAAFSAILMASMLFMGIDGVFLGGRLISAYWHGDSQLTRQRVRMITLGTLLGFGIPGGVLFISAITWGQVAMNLAAFTPFLFTLSLAYAIVKHDLLEIDAMVKRGAYYLLLTGAVGVAYVAAVVVFNSFLQASAVTDSPVFPILFTFAVLLVFNPLRTRLQAFVDRVFFRTRYDGAQVLATLGAQLGSTLGRERIATLVCETVQGALGNEAAHLFVRDGEAQLTQVGAAERVVGDALRRRLAAGRTATAFDPPELYDDADTHAAVEQALDALGGEIAVPLQLGQDLTGALVAGRKRSGLFFTAGDAEFLRAVAHQTAIALANAQSYEALVALNAQLEERVRERTAALERANRELTDALSELKTAEVQLVQSEKMASLGRLVAGVAHEINNPVSFIAGNVAPLRRRLAQAAGLAPPEARRVLQEAEEIADIMGRGAERTAAIVKDLRSFSRLGEAVRKPLDLLDGLETSLRLLGSRWRDRITIHRDLNPLPLIEGDPGQLNQVLLNLLANACDAIPERGNIWLESAVVDDQVVLTIRDDGVGMSSAVRERIFEPFFTTKDVGSGTGLGLAISHSVIEAQGGRIEVESAPGAGATFRLILPIVPAVPRAQAS